VRKHTIILIFLLFPIWNQSEGIQSSIFYQGKAEFAVVICPGINSSYLNYAIVTKSGDKILKTQHLTEQSFMMQITGRMSSPANPKLKNLLREKVSDTCDCVVDNLYKKYLGHNCEPFRLLWKIRYKYDPQNHHLKDYPDYQGWAFTNYSPGIKQGEYLNKRYNINSLSDFIVGDYMFLILKDVQDSVWINEYYYLD
jgi:hypothetical protein